MANDFYRKGAQLQLAAGINWLTDSIKAVLLSTDYVPSMSGDEFLTDINANQLGAAVALTGRNITDGTFDADDITFLAVPAGFQTLGIALVKDTGNPATSPLLGWIDVLTGFPFATNGGDIVVQWNNGVTKLFSLSTT